MRGPFLLDTNVLIWSISASKRLSARANRVMSFPVSSLLVSVISIWEIVLKYQVHKLHLQSGLDQILDQTLDQILKHSPWDILSMKTEHLRSLANVPVLHLDPFDRMLVAQPLHENLTIITADERIREYDVSTLW